MPSQSLSYRLCTALLRSYLDAHHNRRSGRSIDGRTCSDSEPSPSDFDDITTDAPLAATLSEGAIAKAIASGVDPWAQTTEATFPRTDNPTVLFDMLCALRLTTAFPVAAPDAPPLQPGVTLLRIADSVTRQEVSSTLDHVLPFYLMARRADDLTVAQVVHEMPQIATRSPLPDPDTRFRNQLDAALTEHQIVLAIAPSSASLSDSGQSLLRAEAHWPSLTQDILIALLRVTHSTTGQLSEDALRARLPADAKLARTPWPVLVHALGADTSLRVADRLAQSGTAPTPTAPVTLDDVHGLPDVTSALRQLTADVSAWQAGALDWSDVSSSLLFYGPPGTGKTLLAEALAGSAGATFVATSYADCQKAGHLGDYLKAMSENIDRAITHAPSVFFVDELDSYQNRTTMRGQASGYMRAVVNGMLEALTRLNAAEGVIVVAATNDLDLIDPALTRAGRFDQKIAIGLPDKNGVAAILRAHLGAFDDDLGTHSLDLIGQSGAQIAAIARAAKGIARAATSSLTADHVAQAIRQHAPAPCPALMQRRAIHEAGHAVVAHALGLPAGQRLFLSAAGGGYLAPRMDTFTRATAHLELAMILAGRAAETLLCDAPSSGAGGDARSDLAQATKLALEMDYACGLGSTLYHGTCDAGDRLRLPRQVKDRVEASLQSAAKLADRTLRQNRNRLLRVASALMQHRELDAGQLAACLTDMKQGTQKDLVTNHD